MNLRPVIPFRTAITCFVLFGMVAAGLGIPQAAQAAPSREPIYYLSMPEDDALQAFRDNDGGGTAVSPVRSVTSISIALTGTIIYYDHWENGFAADIRTGADLVFGDGNLGNGCPPSLNNTPNPCLVAANDTLQAADVVVLDNLVAVVGAPGGPYSRNPAQVFFDGRDKFQATSPIAAGRALWPTGPGSLQAGGVEMLEYNRWGDLYRFPFGESATFPTGLFEDVRYNVVAGPGGSTIDVDTNGDSIVDATYVLAEGGKQVIHAPSAGGTIQVVSGSNVQVTVAYSDTTDTYEMRWSALIPFGDWSNDYYSPVGTDADDLCTNVWVYNPNPAPITVSWTLGNPVANGSFVVPAGTSAASNTTVGLNRGIRLYTAAFEVFLPFSVTDCSSSAGNQGQIYDWDTSLFPAEQLSAEILVGWAPGCTNESHLGTCRDADGSPSLAASVSRSVVWISPLANTTVYVDTNGSGISCPGGAGAEQTIAAAALASYRIDDDPTSQNNVRDTFNSVSYSRDDGSEPWSAAWVETGDDGLAASGSMGIAGGVLQLRNAAGTEAGDTVSRGRNLSGQIFARLSFQLLSTAGLDGGDDIVAEVSPDGGTSWYVLEQFEGPITTTLTKVYNISPYISTNTTMRFRFVDELEAGDIWSVENVNIQYAPDGDFDMTGAYIRTCDGTQIAAAYGQNPSTSESGDNEALDLGTVITPYYVLIDVELDKQVTDDTPNLGDTVTFTLRVTNTGLVTARNIDVTDVVPDGYTYVPGTIAGGDSRDASNPATTGLAWTINALGPGAFADLAYDATVMANDSGARVYENYAEIQDHTEPDNDSTPGNGSTTEDDDDTLPVTPNGSIRGSVQADTDNDDVGDAPLASVTLTLYTDPNGDGDPSDGAPVAFDVDPVTPGPQSSVVSQADGSYSFASVPPGVYVVVQTDLAGYQSVADNDSIADMPGSPVDAANTSPTDNWLPVNLASAELDSGNDFVDEQSGAVGDYVWDDLDADGIQDSGEVGLGGVTVNLYRDADGDGIPEPGGDDGVAVAATATSLAGAYSFSGLAPGQYFLEFIAPGGYNLSPQNQGGDDTIDSDPASTTGLTTVTSLLAGESDTTWDAGMFQSIDVSLDKQISDATPNVGDTVTFTLVIANGGPSTATNIDVTDVVPSGYTYVASSIGGGDSRNDANPSTTGLTWTINSLANGASVNLTYQAVVLASGTYDNYAEVIDHDQTDSDSVPGNASTTEDDDDTVTVTPTAVIDVSLDKQISNATPNVGDTVTFTLVIANGGPSTATNIDVTDVVPSGYSYVASSIGGGDARNDSAPSTTGLTWTITSLANGASVNLTYQAVVLASGTYDNYAEVIDHDQTDSDSVPGNASTTEDDDDTVTVTPQAATISDPAVTKTGNPPTAVVGDIVTFTIVVTNNGTANADSVTLTDPIPAFLDIVNVTAVPAAGATVSIVGNTVTVSFGTLTPGETYTVTITTVVNSLGAPPGGTNTATVTTTSADADPNNNASAALVTIVTATGEPAPATGFAPDQTTILPAQPNESAYLDIGDLWIEIPALGVKLPIVGIPLTEDGWDVTWLGKLAGYLNGTAFPTWEGNSVITSHVTLASGRGGPFRYLSTLRWDDTIIVHYAGQRYVYSVRSTSAVTANDTSIFRHEERAWVTLVTCGGYDARLGEYRYRIVVKAVLTSIEAEP